MSENGKWGTSELPNWPLDMMINIIGGSPIPR